MAAEVADAKKHVVIMGAGLIGCEFANDLISSGLCCHGGGPREQSHRRVAADRFG